MPNLNPGTGGTAKKEVTPLNWGLDFFSQAQNLRSPSDCAGRGPGDAGFIQQWNPDCAIPVARDGSEQNAIFFTASGEFPAEQSVPLMCPHFTTVAPAH